MVVGLKEANQGRIPTMNATIRRTPTLLIAITAAASLVLTFSSTAPASAAQPVAQSAVAATTAAGNAEQESPLEMVSSGTDYMTLTTSEGEFLVNDDGSVSIVDNSGEELYPLGAAGVSEEGGAAPMTYELDGHELTISWDHDGTTGDTPGEIANVAPMAAGLTWGCVLSYLGLLAGTVGVIVATGGTATIFILGVGTYVINIAAAIESCN